MTNKISPSSASYHGVLAPPDSHGVLVWAIDPLEKGARPGPELLQSVLNWVRKAGLEIEPVYLLHPPKNESNSFLEAGGVARYISAAERTAEKYLHELGIEGEKVRAVKVLVVDDPSRSEQVLVLSRFAEERNAQCVVVTSHGRSGLPRLFLGSFAEHLLMHSRIPVFFLGNSGNAPDMGGEIKRVLFPTDFSDVSLEAFQDFLRHARRSHFEVCLFHSVFLPSVAFDSGAGAPIVIPDNYFSVQAKWASTEGAKWVRMAQAHGVQAHFKLRDEGVGPYLGESILAAARELGVSAIAMVAEHEGSPSRALAGTGGVARDVFRSGLYPIWVYGPRAFKKRVVRPVEDSVSA